MEANWYEATYLLETLVLKAEGLDEDGMDLHFTAGPTVLEGKDSADKFVNSMKKACPVQGTNTDLRRSLGNFLNDYQQKLRNRNRRPVKDKVLVILTNGIWGGMEDGEGVANLLRIFAEELRGLNIKFKQRPFSVQFIQLGTDEAAKSRLDYLDDFLGNEGFE